MERRRATWDGYAILMLLSSTIALSILTPYAIILVVLSTLILIHQILLRIIFRGPEKRSKPFSSKEWEILHANNDGFDIFGFINYQPNISDLVVFIHGWHSSSEKYTERMQLFRDKGLHTLAIDMRGHGMAPDTPEWTAGKVIQDIKIILAEIDKDKVEKIHFYGHSLGAFVCIGMHHERHQGWWKENYGTLMLESPMVAYSPILEQQSAKISFLIPLLKRLAIMGFKKIHPEVGKLEWKDIDIPEWGLPKVPILLLQAKEDSRLGRYHYNLLMAQELDIHAHLIESLTHSRNRINPQRDQIIVKWIDEEIL